jgi:hypothetical protein
MLFADAFPGSLSRGNLRYLKNQLLLHCTESFGFTEFSGFHAGLACRALDAGIRHLINKIHFIRLQNPSDLQNPPDFRHYSRNDRMQVFQNYQIKIYSVIRIILR